MTEIMYLAKDNPSLTLKLAGKRWTAEGGVFKLSPEAAKELDALMKSRPDIRSVVSRIDMDKAAEVAKANLEKARANPAAVQGAVTSVNSATNKLREAAKGQTPENLTGKINPQNLATQAKNKEPLKVDQANVSAPKSGILDRLKK